jgi:diacylglycerol kinase family enzyme
VARALLITNPAAARTTHGAVQVVSDTMRQAGWTLEVLATGGPGDARKLAAYAVEAGMDLVAVQGGDGTTMQAAAALVGTDVALGLIPGGTCGAGIDARVMAETASEEKRRWGIGAYMATALRVLPEMRSHRYLVTVDGVEYEANAAMILVANCGEVIPPLVKLGHGINPYDGFLDAVVVQADGVWDTVRAIWHVLRDLPPTHESGTLIGYARGRTISVECDSTQPVELDGEAGGTTPFTAEVVPGAISVIVPNSQGNL